MQAVESLRENGRGTNRAAFRAKGSGDSRPNTASKRLASRIATGMPKAVARISLPKGNNTSRPVCIVSLVMDTSTSKGMKGRISPIASIRKRVKKFIPSLAQAAQLPARASRTPNKQARNSICRTLLV